jgi:O-acetyl-ADP-ribose deacetylase (regulator of RNase III)
MMTITIKKGDITLVRCDAIVNPANSYGYMGGGVAGAIKRKGGIEIEKEAIGKAPIKIGDAIATTAGKLPCKYVIHAPTMEKPAMQTNVYNIEFAVKGALKLAKELGIKIIAIPGMGTGIGGVEEEKAAEKIVEVSKDFEKYFDEIILIDINEKMVNAFRKYVQ